MIIINVNASKILIKLFLDSNTLTLSVSIIHGKHTFATKNT